MVEEEDEEEDDEEDEEEDQGSRSSAAHVVVPLQAPEPVEGGSVWPGLFSGEGAREEGWGPSTGEKAQWKACTVEAPPSEIDKEMVRHLPQEEQEAKRAQRGQDAATLVVVREAAGLLTWGQVEGLAGPS